MPCTAANPVYRWACRLRPTRRRALEALQHMLTSAETAATADAQATAASGPPSVAAHQQLPPLATEHAEQQRHIWHSLPTGLRAGQNLPARHAQLWASSLAGLPALALASSRDTRCFSTAPNKSTSSQTSRLDNSSAAADGQNDEAVVPELPHPPLVQPAPGPVLRLLPPSWLPYAHLMRLEKPIGIWLLAWPCFWSIALAAPAGALPDLHLLALFGAGAVLLRGAGCTVNDLWDRDLDRQVERTKTRPLAAGLVTPMQALVFLAGQLLLGLGILVQLNAYSIVLGASSLLLVGSYPLMKRVTHWPQLFLGLTFNWGALLGWAAVHGSCAWPVVLPLYLAGASWTLVYDTIYAHQDKQDDIKAGVKSTALLFGDRTKPWLSGFAASYAGLLALSGHTAGCGALFDLGLAASAGHLAWQISAVNLDDARDCMDTFVSNTRAGGLVFAGIFVDKVAGSPSWTALLSA